MEAYCHRAESSDYYWEHLLKLELVNLPPMYIKDTTNILYEFENLEELRRFDTSYMEETNNFIMQIIAEVLKCSQGEISDISVIKNGMSNRSFKFTLRGKPYIFRLPGADTGKLVNRNAEKKAYEALAPYGITDTVLYFDGDSGIKISEFIPGCHDSDPFNDAELKLCMEKIAEIHSHKIKLSSDFDIENKTYYYTQLAKELNAIRFQDFDEMTVRMKKLYELKKRLNIEESFCHGDFAHVNVLILPDKTGRVIDLEFCGNGDPIMDVSMFAIFAQFDRTRIELCLRYYLKREPEKEEWLRLFLYVAIGAFLWTAWAEYKQANGSEFGDYALKMYRYAKDYYKICDSMAGEPCK
jgi:thiamine kinase-like enzyme